MKAILKELSLGNDIQVIKKGNSVDLFLLAIHH